MRITIVFDANDLLPERNAIWDSDNGGSIFLGDRFFPRDLEFIREITKLGINYWKQEIK